MIATQAEHTTSPTRSGLSRQRGSSPVFGNVYACYTHFRCHPVRPSRSPSRARPMAVRASSRPNTSALPTTRMRPGGRGARWAPTATATSTSPGRTRSRTRRLAALDLDDGGKFAKPRASPRSPTLGTSTACARSRSTASPGRGRARSRASIRERSAKRRWGAEHDRARLVGRRRRPESRARARPAIQQRRPGWSAPVRSSIPRSPGLRVHRHLARRHRPVRRLRRVPRPVPREHDLDPRLPGRPEARRRLRDDAQGDDDAGSGRGRRAGVEANTLIDEFIGDYNTVVATNGGAVSVSTTPATPGSATR